MGSIARLSCAWVALMVTAPALAAAGGQNPDSAGRAALLTAERDKKTTEVTAPERSLVERSLYWYDNQYVLAKVFGGWYGVHMAGGDFPAGAGMKFGIGFDHAFHGSTANPAQANRIDVQARTARSLRGYTRTAAAVNVHNLASAPLDLRVAAQRYEFPQEDFFGLGADSRREDRTDYLLKGNEGSLDLRWRPVRTIDLGAGVAYIDPRVGSGTDPRFPSTAQVYDPATVPGLATQSDYLRADASVAFDWRDNPLHPHAGGQYRAKLSDFSGRDFSTLDFRRVELDVQQYVPLPNRYRTLALRAAAVLTDTTAGNQVPFFYQPTLGGSQALRGFREFRFRDRNSLLLSGEYRWEAWWALDGALFVDAGTVAADRRDLNLRDLDVSYGVGFRVHSNSAFVARLDLAFSREGFIPLLRFEHVF